MNVFLFNGPPGSGKDTAGKMLAEILGPETKILKFAALLKLATHAAMAIFRRETKIDPVDAHEADKDEIKSELWGITWRDAYKMMSEGWAKPLFGQGWFGEMMLRDLKTLREAGTENVVITDCGFEAEVSEILGDGDDVTLIRMYREGCTFENDSRSYLKFPDDQVCTVDLENNGSLKELRRSVFNLAALYQES